MKIDAETIMDILGNESRRKILELLSRKPCYVSEISYYLGMAPKAVLEHLDKLVKAGVVASFEEGRRRYYYIPRNIRLEVVISPHKFDAEIRDGETYDLQSLIKEIRNEFSMMERLRAESISEIYKALRVAEDLQKTFSRMQSYLSMRFNQFVERMLNEIERVVSDDLERLVLLGLAKGLKTSAEIAETFRLPYREVERALDSLNRRGLVERRETDGEVVWIIK
uniref:Metalloregulator ArsR/SmtB family transcription factor n=1 Tax=Archaeoglobus fulgidus TaxID=2234 RepID=A0A7C3RCN7_ARCFL